MRRPWIAAAAVALTLAPGAAAATGPQIWSQAGCGSCHTLRAAAASGTAGPNLDALRPSSAAVAAQVSSGGGGMPAFSGSLSAGQIQQLASWVATVTGAATSAPAGNAPPGMSTATVRLLQQRLARLGYFHHAVTGFYGAVTTKAVARFQRAHGLHPDGVWGPLSQAALDRLSH